MNLKTKVNIHNKFKIEVRDKETMEIKHSGIA